MRSRSPPRLRATPPATYMVAGAAEELSASIGEIGKQLDRAKILAERALGEAEATNAEIGSLSEAARRIGDVVDLIRSIADQTNLLALNATIEAARAGDAGKGFAVVASEVKTAAYDRKGTEETLKQILAVQTSTDGAVGAIRPGSSRDGCGDQRDDGRHRGLHDPARFRHGGDLPQRAKAARSTHHMAQGREHGDGVAADGGDGFLGERGGSAPWTTWSSAWSRRSSVS